MLVKMISDKEINQLIKREDLLSFENLKNFILHNEHSFSTEILSKIAELSNSLRSELGAYYTDVDTIEYIYNRLPEINKDTIRILEPSVGMGNFIQSVVEKYSKCKNLIIDVCDIDNRTIEILKILVDKMNLSNNVKINYINNDFMLEEFNEKYDLVIGNPPFVKLKKNMREPYARITKDYIANNLSAFFIEKAVNIADYVVMIMPKYFLHNTDFEVCRELINLNAIDSIVDFGENGFKGVLVETICLFIDTNKQIGKTECISITQNICNEIPQQILTDKKYPNWLIYRNVFFENVAKSLQFNIFNVYRDRQITNKILSEKNDVWVIKSRNIARDGKSINHVNDYDAYISNENREGLSVNKYFERDDVYLTPNMTYYPRVVRKPKNILTNGSVAILEVIDNVVLNDEELLYFASDEFYEFYRIARNYSTRSLNVDKNSIYYFGRKLDGNN